MMESELGISSVEEILDYGFTDKSLIRQALSAAERLEDMNTGEVLWRNDGNRLMAQLGLHAMQLVLVETSFSAGWSRNDIQGAVERCTSNVGLANAAKAAGLDVHITCSQRQQGSLASPRTLASTIKAIIGAVWLDSKGNFMQTTRVVRSLGVFALGEDSL